LLQQETEKKETISILKDVSLFARCLSREKAAVKITTEFLHCQPRVTGFPFIINLKTKCDPDRGVQFNIIEIEYCNGRMMRFIGLPLIIIGWPNPLI